MVTQKVLATLIVASAIALPTAPLAEVVLNGRMYPEHRRAELLAACQGLEGKDKESLTARDNSDEESGDPASDFQLSMVLFTLSDCKAAGLIQ